jgi:hypothetical protein
LFIGTSSKQSYDQSMGFDSIKVSSLILGLLVVLCSACGSINPSAAQCSLASFLTLPTQDRELAIRSTSFGGVSVAQSFIPTSAGSAASATVFLKRYGSFSSGLYYLTATLEGNQVTGSTSVPDNIPLATSTRIDVSAVSSNSPGYYTFTFSSSASLNADQTYWLRIRASYPLSDTHYVSWMAYDGPNGYLVNSTSLNSVYELSQPNTFSNALIGEARYLLFSIGC